MRAQLKLFNEVLYKVVIISEAFCYWTNYSSAHSSERRAEYDREPTLFSFYLSVQLTNLSLQNKHKDKKI